MTAIEKIRAEIKERISLEKELLKRAGDSYRIEGSIDALKGLLSFLDTIEKEPVSEDLEEAAINYIAPIENEDGLKVINFSGQDIKDAFIAGANWQKEKDTRDMVMSDNRQFQKVYELGKKDMMEKMMKEKINEIIEYINGKEEN